MVTNPQLEEFWEKYLNTPAREMYEESMQLFSQELPEEFWEDYAWDELVLEVHGHLEEANEFQKVLNFIKLLQEKHPKFFEELHAYLDDFLVTYYLYHQNREKLQEVVNRFLRNPAKDIDYFVKALHQVSSFQQEDLAAQMSDPAVYRALEAGADEEEEGYGIELFGTRFYLEVRNQYRLYQQTGTYNWVPIRKSLQRYDYELSPEYLKDLSVGLSSPLPEPASLQKLFSENFSKCLLQLEGYFLKAMDQKGLSMLTAGVMWDMLKEFWLLNNLPKNKSGKLLFSFKAADYQKFVKSKGVFQYLDIGADVAMLLWGTQLVYDFLLASGLISEKIHQNMLQSLLEEKGFFIADYQSEIWAFRFVHNWPRPDSMEETQWETEKEIFSRSYELKDPLQAPSEHLLKGLNPQNPLVASIAMGYQKQMDKRAQYDVLLEKEFSARSEKANTTSKFKNPAPFLLNPQETSLRPPKVGRNEPCPCGSGKKYKKCCGS